MKNFFLNLTFAIGLLVLPCVAASHVADKGPEQAAGAALLLGALELVALNSISRIANPSPNMVFGLLGDNDTGILSGTIVAQRTLEFLHVMFPALFKISTNYSDQQLLFKQSMLVQVPHALTAHAWDKATGYAPDPADVEQLSVTIDQHDHVSFGFNDQEVSATNRNLIDEHAITSAYALGSKLFAYVFGKVLPANIKHEFVQANADWDRRTVIDINGILNGRGVSPLNRFAIVGSRAFAELLDDESIVSVGINSAAGGLIANNTGQVLRVHGMDIMEWPAIPAGAFHLGGYAGTSQGLAVATCVPKDPASVNPGVPIPGNIELVTDDNTGATLMVREHYDMRMGYHQVTLTWMYGASLGLTNTGERIVTQATGEAGTIVDVLN